MDHAGLQHGERHIRNFLITTYIIRLWNHVALLPLYRDLERSGPKQKGFPKLSWESLCFENVRFETDT